MKQLNIRSSASRALAGSVGLFLTALLLIPVSAIINRVFDGSWQVNWRLTLSVAGILTVLWFGFLFVSQVLEDFTEAQRQEAGVRMFPGAMWIRGISIGVILLGLVTMAGCYREGDAWWFVAFPFVFVLLGFFTWPRAIEITNNEIRQRGQFLNTRILPSNEIQSATFDSTRGEIAVFGNNGAKIVHTTTHVNGAQFIRALEELTGRQVAVLGSNLGGSSK